MLICYLTLLALSGLEPQRSLITIRHISDGYEEIIKTHDKVLLLLYPKSSPNVGKELEKYNDVYQDFRYKMFFLRCYSDVNADFSSFPTDLKQAIMLYKGGVPLGTYEGKWSVDKLIKLCRKLTTPPSVRLISSISQYYEFINRSYAHAIILGETSKTKGFLEAIQQHNIILSVGKIESPTLISLLGFSRVPHMLVNRPKEKMSYKFLDASDERIKKSTKPFINNIHYSDIFGSSLRGRWILGAITTESDRDSMVETFKHCSLAFKGAVGFHECSSFTCEQLNKFGAGQTPIYYSFFNDPSTKTIIPILYRGSDKSRHRIRMWMRSIMDNYFDDMDFYQGQQKIAVFNETVIQRKSIILLCEDSHPMYESAMRNLVQIAYEIPENRKFNFYTFNPKLGRGNLEISKLFEKGKIVIVMYNRKGQRASSVLENDMRDVINRLYQRLGFRNNLFDTI